MKKMLSSMFLLIMGLTLLGCDPPLDEDGDIVITAGEEVTVEVYSKSILGATCKLDDCEIRYEPTDVDFNNVGEYVIYYEAFVNDEYEKYAIQFVNVVDTTPPVCSSLAHQTLTLGEEHVFPEPVCEDNYSFVEIIPEEHIDMTTPGDYYIDYICKDTSGNETLVTWTFTLVDANDPSGNDTEPTGDVITPVPGTSGYTVQTIDAENNIVVIAEDMSMIDAQVTDIDLDGDDDVVYLDGFQGEIYYLRNDGAEFTRVFIDDSWGPQKLVLADLDQDGDDDIVVSSFAERAITVYTNHQTTFTKEQLISEGQPQTLVALDFDLDGDLDIIDFEYYDNNIAVYGNDNGTLSMDQYLASSSVEVQVEVDVTAFDYENDGDMDVLVADRTNDSLYILKYTNGYMLPVVIDSIKGVAPTMVDLDGDSDLDLLVIEYHGDNLYAYENVEGTFTNRSILTNTLFDGRTMEVVDNNGSFEVYIPGYRTYYILKDVTLTSATVETFSIQGISKENAQFIDVDSDGDLDVFYHSMNKAFVLIR